MASIRFLWLRCRLRVPCATQIRLVTPLKPADSTDAGEARRAMEGTLQQALTGMVFLQLESATVRVISTGTGVKNFGGGRISPDRYHREVVFIGSINSPIADSKAMPEVRLSTSSIGRRVRGALVAGAWSGAGRMATMESRMIRRSGESGRTPAARIRPVGGWQCRYRHRPAERSRGGWRCWSANRGSRVL